ncbi:MAG TPA: glycosyltransferase [Mucilaginibacter sp.]|nr:glycosyltransferase [Mucilaginibacter sp.]
MNIVVFSHDVPWPPVHGGRIDLHNRLKAFKELGHDAFLVCWALHRDNKREENIQHIKDTIDGVICFSGDESIVSRIIHLLARLVKLTIQPNLVSRCSLSRKGLTELKRQLESFRPDVVFVDNIYAARLAYQYASLVDLPVFVRSHNIEHLYIKKMAAIASSYKTKLHFLAMSANLKKYEKNMLKRADAFFDISLVDLEFWKEQGLTNGYWMPPVYYNNYLVSEKGNIDPILFDVAYIGNLNSPNNIQGLFWFFEKVLPILNAKYPGASVLVAGSRPIESLVNYCSHSTNVTLLANPEDVISLYGRSKVLVNPTLAGSGVNIKSIEMLHLDNPVVCTPKAVEGLPTEIKAAFDATSDPEEFAIHILKHLQHPDDLVPSRKEARTYFSPNYLAANIEIMKGLTEKHGNQSQSSKIL